MVLIPGIENVNFAPYLSQFVYWFGWGLLYVVVMAAMVAAWYLWKFNITATVFPMYGSGQDGVFSFGKPKKNRIRWVNNRTAWKALFPLMNKKEIEPFDSEFIYPGNRVYVFELNDTWTPGRININETEEKIRANINPVPYYARNWQSLTHKKHAAEFAKQGFWEENKYLVITIGVVLFNLVLCGTVIYFTYKFAGGGQQSMNELANAINNMGNIPGIGNIPK